MDEDMGLHNLPMGSHFVKLQYLKPIKWEQLHLILQNKYGCNQVI